MNLSGFVAKDISILYNIEPNRFLIVYDDFNLPLNEMRFKLFGSSGGHNGMQSIIDIFNTNNIPRLRVGIGKPDINPRDYVLTEFDNNQQLEKLINNGVNAIELIIKEDYQRVMNNINKRRIDE